MEFELNLVARRVRDEMSARLELVVHSARVQASGISWFPLFTHTVHFPFRGVFNTKILKIGASYDDW
jgi:hypothetical protein